MKQFKYKLLEVNEELLIKKMAKFGQIVMLNKSKNFMISFQVNYYIQIYPKYNQTVIIIPSSGSIDKNFSKPIKLYLCKPVYSNNLGYSRNSILSHHSYNNQQRIQQRDHCNIFQKNLIGKKKQPDLQKFEQFLQNYQEKHEIKVRLDQSYWIERNNLNSKQRKQSKFQKFLKETNLQKISYHNIIPLLNKNKINCNLTQQLNRNDKSNFQLKNNKKQIKNQGSQNINISYNGFQHKQPICPEKQIQLSQHKSKGLKINFNKSINNSNYKNMPTKVQFQAEFQKNQNQQSIRNKSLQSSNNRKMKILFSKSQKIQFRLPVQLEIKNKEKKNLIDQKKQKKINFSPITKQNLVDSSFKIQKHVKFINSFQQSFNSFNKNSINKVKDYQFANYHQKQNQILKKSQIKKRLFTTPDKKKKIKNKQQQTTKIKCKIAEIIEKLQEGKLCSDDKEMMLSQANKLMSKLIEKQNKSDINSQIIILLFILIIGMVVGQIFLFSIF